MENPSSISNFHPKIVQTFYKQRTNIFITFLVNIHFTNNFTNIFTNSFIGTANNELAFTFVFIIAVAITSIPVISKIFFDIGVMNTNFSNMVLTVSTLQDLVLWILLNMSISLVETGTFKVSYFLITTALTIGLLGVAKLVEYIVKKHKIIIKNNIRLYRSVIYTQI